MITIQIFTFFERFHSVVLQKLQEIGVLFFFYFTEPKFPELINDWKCSRVTCQWEKYQSESHCSSCAQLLFTAWAATGEHKKREQNILTKTNVSTNETSGKQLSYIWPCYIYSWCADRNKKNTGYTENHLTITTNIIATVATNITSAIIINRRLLLTSLIITFYLLMVSVDLQLLIYRVVIFSS